MLAAVFALGLLASGCLKTPDRYAASTLDVTVNPPATFELDGQPFCFAGSNNYYPIFKPRPVVDDLFDAAKTLNFRVMRVWGMLDRGSLDGTVKNTDGEGHKQDVYFQYWDTENRRPAYNDGENGLERLDYVLSKAEKVGVKVIVVLVNNWKDFGGMDQYLVWFGREHHDEFYTAPDVRQAYKNWAEHLVMRKNTITGRLYRDDPTIFSWELANEPRCIGGGPFGFDRKQGWTSSTITEWAREMSGYIKSIDPNHMVSVGDEGFLDGGGTHWAYKANDGVDHEALTGLPGIDFGTFHLYPEDWGATLDFGTQWIVDHLRVARELGKPTVLEEYGVKVGRTEGNLGQINKGWEERAEYYQLWNRTMLERGGNGTLAWMLAGIDEDKPRYPDYDHFVFYDDDATGKLIGGYAERFNRAAPACDTKTPSSGSLSPFVRARRPPVEVASGWVGVEARNL